ncbi:hypothetical protein Tco_0494540 [Tanacetum coccineum]
MIDRDKIMVAAGGNIMRKTPQETYDLIENMTQHHYQWESEVHEQVEVLGNDIGYTIQSVQHQPGPEDKLSEAKKSKIDPLIREPSDTFLTGDKEIKFNPLKDIDDPFPIPRTILSLIFRNKESDESETETIMKEVAKQSCQSDVASVSAKVAVTRWLANHRHVYAMTGCHNDSIGTEAWWLLRDNIMRKTPQETYDLIDNMTQHHYQWESKVQNKESDKSETETIMKEWLAELSDIDACKVVSAKGGGLKVAGSFTSHRDTDERLKTREWEMYLENYPIWQLVYIGADMVVSDY